MVCIYCGQNTQVINSRLQKRANQIWRRRKCLKCGAVFSTHEHAVYEAAWRVKTSRSSLEPFVREKLFLSLYKSCSHRKTATYDAVALTDTVISGLGKQIRNGVIESETIAHEAMSILKRFDTPAAVHYKAFHPGV